MANVSRFSRGSKFGNKQNNVKSVALGAKQRSAEKAALF